MVVLWAENLVAQWADWMVGKWADLWAEKRAASLAGKLVVWRAALSVDLLAAGLVEM